MATQRVNETFGDPTSAEAVRKAVDALARRITIGVGDTLVDFKRVPPALLVQALAGMCYAMRDDERPHPSTAHSLLLFGSVEVEGGLRTYARLALLGNAGVAAQIDLTPTDAIALARNLLQAAVTTATMNGDRNAIVGPLDNLAGELLAQETYHTLRRALADAAREEMQVRAAVAAVRT